MKTKTCCYKLLFGAIVIFLVFTFGSSAQSPGIECGCNEYDSYKAPSVKEILIEQGATVNEAHSANNKYQVVVHSAINNQVSISVQENSKEILQGLYPASGWGFSPDEDKFVIHGLDHNGWHWVWLYNLNPDPSVLGEEATGTQIISPTNVSSARISFSPHGKYLVYGAIGSVGNLVLYVFDTKDQSVVYSVVNGVDIIGSPAGESVAGWGFSPDRRDRSFAHAVLTNIDNYGVSTYTLIVKNLETNQDIIRAGGSRGTAAFRFSPCGDYFLWIYQTPSSDPTCNFYKTGGPDIGDIEQGSGIGLKDVYTKADGHYIKYFNGSVKIFDNTSDEDCPDKTPPSWPGGSELSLSNNTGTTIDLSWPEAGDSKGPILYSVIVNGEPLLVLEDNTSYQVSGLVPNSTGNSFEVLAGDESGNWTNPGLVADNITMNNDEEPVWDGASLYSVAASGTTLRLGWSPGATDDNGISYYRILQTDGPSYTISGDSLFTTIRGLVSQQSYSFNIEAGDAADQWVSGGHLDYTMPLDHEPTWPNEATITVEETTETSALFSWVPADDDFGVTKYEIEKDGVAIGSTQHYLRQYEAVDLEQGKTYPFAVFAVDESGNKSEPLEKDITTVPAFTELPLVTGAGIQRLPDIDGEIVVWQDDRNGNKDIYEYHLDVGKEIALVTNPEFQSEPAVSGERIVWEDARNHNESQSDIYIHYPWQGDIPVCDEPGFQASPEISGTYVTWSDLRGDDYDIYLFNLVTLEEKVICSASGRQAFPSISGHIVVWEDYRNGDADIYGYNIYTDEVFKICKEAGDQTRPSVYVKNVLDYTVVWTDERGSDKDLYMYRSFHHVDAILSLYLGYGSNQTGAHIADGQLVYMDDKNGSWDIYAYQFTNPYSGEIVPVCLEAGDQLNPRTSKGRVVWEDHRNDEGDIYIWDRPPGVDLMLELVEKTDPVPKGKTLVYELSATNDGPDNELSAMVQCLLPVNAMLESFNADKGNVSEEGLSLTWNIGALKNDSAAILKIYLRTYEIGDLNFRAEISGSGFDPDPSNNTINEVTEVKIVVGEELGIGEEPSLFAEDYGKVHAVYGTSDSVVYASKIPDGIWQYELLDTVSGFSDSDILMDKSGNIHIAYSDNIYDKRPDSRLFYLTDKNAGIWHNSIIALSDTGFSSIAADLSPGDNIHMFYQKSPGAAWTAPFMYQNCMADDWSYPSIFYPEGYDHIDMVLDSDGFAHTCFIGINIGPIYRKSQDTIISSWNADEVIEEAWRGAQLEGMVLDIDVDAQNNPHIIYPGGTNGDGKENIKYAWKDGTSWKVQQIDIGANQSGANAIVADDNGSVHVSYFHQPTGELRYGTNIAGPWIKQTIEKEATGWDLSLDMDGDEYGNIHLLYENQGMVKYALRPAIEYFTVDRDTLDFGLVKLDSSKTIQLTLLNDMANRILIDSVRVLDPRGFIISKPGFVLYQGIKDSLTITFAPKEMLAVSSYLRIYFTSNSRLFMDIPVFARTPSPGLNVNPESVNLGTVTPYTHVRDTVEISNEGEVDLIISDVNVKYEMFGYEFPTDFSLVSQDCGILAPGEQCEAIIDFYPRKTGAQTSYLNITSNDALNPYKQVRLSGNGQYPRALITASTYTLDYAYLDMNQSSTKSFMIRSVGDLDLTISNITLTGVNADQFSISQSCTSIAPGESCEVEVTFNPTIADDCTASINIYSNSTYSNPMVISLMGTSVERNLAVSEAGIDFGNISVGEESLMLITLTNTETSDLTVSSTAILGRDMYEFVYKGFNGTLAGGESVTDSIWFSPLFAGSKSASYRIASNDTDEDTITITLSGTAEEGIAPLRALINASQLSGSVPLEIDFTVSVSGGTSPYSFDWSFGDGEVSTEQSPVHTFNDIGTYEVLLTITDAELNSVDREISINAAALVYSLSGNIFEDNGISEVSKGYAALYRAGSYNYEQLIGIIGTNSYTFNNLTEDEYTVRFYPDPDEYPEFLPTYLGDVPDLYNASYVTVNSDLSNQDINLVAKPGEGSGDGTINGNVVEGSGKGNTVVTFGESKAGSASMAGILVYLVNNSSGQVEAYDITDESGYFEFKGLPNDEYKFIVDYKGLPMDPANPLLILTPVADSISILATVSGIEITTEVLATGINQPDMLSGFAIYPNPASELIYIKGINTENIGKVTLIGLQGNRVISRKDVAFTSGYNEISIADTAEGVYILRIETKNGTYNRRLVIIR
ncbi:MAG: choice-of-anchor D domain-containing protein [Marinilabiliaceae bacterium]|jgi:beta propeller repeat protein|nr:choice-of-anchor D domain-containing protein [Marinilabiliaceae bacterium]